MRISIFQLILLSTGIAAFFAWFSQDRTRKLVWLDSTLEYVSPDVPVNYELPLPPQLGWFGSNQVTQLLPRQSFSHGAELFQAAHESGWKSCRYNFYSDFDYEVTYQIQRKLEQIDLTKDENVDSAAKLAYAIGYNECQEQIDHLLTQHSKRELRQEIALRKSDSLPILVIAIVSLFCFTISFVVRPPKKPV